MNENKFRTHANSNARIATFGGIIILVIIALFSLLYSESNSISLSRNLLIPGIFWLFFVYVIGSALLKFFIVIEIKNHGLLIKKPFFHRRFIPASDIAKVVLFDEGETRRKFEQELQGQQGYKYSDNLVGYIQKMKKESRWYKYLTVTARGTSTGTGKAETIQSVTIKAEMILLELKNQQKLFLSPQNIHVFYEKILKMVNTIQ